MKIRHTSLGSIAASMLLLTAWSASAQSQTNFITGFDTPDDVTNTPVWINWFGGAFQGLAWNTNDAAGSPTSGSLVITSSWSGVSQQFVVINGFNGINPAIASPDINGFVVTNFQCDVRFDSLSATQADGTFGPLSLGSRGTGFGQPVFGTIKVPSSNTNWVHVSMPVNVNATPAFASLPDVLVKLDTFGGGAMSGTSLLYVDNIQFLAGIPLAPPPTMSLVPAGPRGLRIFAGSTLTMFDREEFATVDQNQSWIGGTYPVSYSFTLLSFPGAAGNIGQTHIFLVPIAFSPNGATGYNGLDYTASNGLWLVINPQGANSVTATVVWKTNAPNSNPANVALLITNTTAVGTWTLTFNSDTTGTLTAPGASPASFTVTDPNVTVNFANPVVAYFGLQPNSVAGEGNFEDWGSVSITGVAGVSASQDFTTSTALTADFFNFSALPGSLVFVTDAARFWLTWNVPDNGFGLGANADLLNTNTWFTPGYYNGGSDIPVTTQMGPARKWTLIKTNQFPTTDGQPLGPVSGNGFFRLSKPPPVQ